MKPEIGFVGLGTMGKWMALNLIKAGFPLKFFARKQGVIDEAKQAGGEFVSTPRKVAEGSQWIVFCVPNTDTVEEILYGKEGIAEILKPGQVVIDCSTIHPLATRKIAEQLGRQGVALLDAPISGMEARAKAGTLTIIVGGEEAAYQKVLPALNAMGNKILYVGPSGNGQLMKLTNQLLFNINCAAMSEVLVMAVKMGLDPEQVVSVSRSGTAQSFALDNFGPLLLEGNFGPGYPMEDAYKDMDNAAEISALHHIPLPVTAATMSTYQIALNQGYGRENKSAMIKVWEKMMGVEVRKKRP